MEVIFDNDNKIVCDVCEQEAESLITVQVCKKCLKKVMPNIDLDDIIDKHGNFKKKFTKLIETPTR